MRANSIFGFLGAGHIGHAGIIGTISSLLNELVGGRVVSSMARSSRFGSAIENELNRKINVIAHTLASNLDPVGQGAQGTVRPARAACDVKKKLAR